VTCRSAELDTRDERHVGPGARGSTCRSVSEACEPAPELTVLVEAVAALSIAIPDRRVLTAIKILVEFAGIRRSRAVEPSVAAQSSQVRRCHDRVGGDNIASRRWVCLSWSGRFPTSAPDDATIVVKCR
jgi:hypothetical protein